VKGVTGIEDILWDNGQRRASRGSNAFEYNAAILRVRGRGEKEREKRYIDVQVSRSQRVAALTWEEFMYTPGMENAKITMKSQRLKFDPCKENCASCATSDPNYCTLCDAG